MAGWPILRCLTLVLLFAPWAMAQAPALGLGLDDAAPGLGDDNVLEVSAHFSQPEEGQTAYLWITAKIQPGWHIYSVTQRDGGPLPTRIKLDASEQVRVDAPFRVSPAPAVGKEPEAFGDLPIETHDGEVTWWAPLRLSDGVDPASLVVAGKLNVQACNENGCLAPKNYLFRAQVGPAVTRLLPAAKGPAPAPAVEAAAAPPDGHGRYQPKNVHATIEGQVTPAVVRPGGTVRLQLTARPAPTYHVFAWEATDSKGASKPTLIVLDEGSWPAGQPLSDERPTQHPLAVGGGTQLYHETPVTWTVEVTVPNDAAAGPHSLGGYIGFQTCFESACDMPTAARFAAQVTVDPTAPDAGAGAPLDFWKAKYSDAAKRALAQVSEENKSAAAPLPTTTEQASSLAAATAGLDAAPLEIVGDEELTQMPLWLAMFLGFVGGAILNLMPCVLPVIGLKILTFVEQSAHSRWRVFELNLWYSAGLLAVFLVLATLAAFAGLGWGGLNAHRAFTISLAVVVFAMSLSFLGVWEIPIPGFAGGRTASDLASQEGPLGAFCKGVITTILATPCSAPFLASALVWAAAQPPSIIYLTFFCIALGMASPYLAIGAFPRLIRWLPKPGAWMDTFKQLMGFVLLGTVVFLFTSIPTVNQVPTLALMFVVWLACWWIGRVPFTAPTSVRLTHKWGAVWFAAVVGPVLFFWLTGVMQERYDLAVDAAIGARVANGELSAKASVANAEDTEQSLRWQPFTRKTLDELTREGHTVLVDFTAPWCTTCLTLEETVLNAQATRALLAENQVVLLKANWTDEYPETGEMLRELKSTQIPVIAIFPAGRPHRVTVFRGAYSQSGLLKALRDAGPSKGTTASSTAAAALPDGTATSSR